MNLTYKDDFTGVSDDVILKEIQNGNEELLSVIFDRYRPVVSLLAKKFSSSPWEHDDLVQEGLIALYSAIRLYDFSSASFSTFASVCIKRGMISALRQSNKARHIPNELFLSVEEASVLLEDDPETSFIDKETVSAFLSDIKRTLSSFEYTVLSRYLLLGNYKEACDSLGISRKEMDNALQRARKKIKKINGDNR